MKTGIANNDRAKPRNSFIAFRCSPGFNNLTLSSLQISTVLNANKAKYLPCFIPFSGNSYCSWADRNLKMNRFLEFGRDVVVVLRDGGLIQLWRRCLCLVRFPGGGVLRLGSLAEGFRSLNAIASSSSLLNSRRCSSWRRAVRSSCRSGI